MNATAMNASQPKIAVFLWPALQRPIRAARLRERLTSLSVASGVCAPFAGCSGSFWMMRVFIVAPWVTAGTRSTSQSRNGGGIRYAVRFIGRVSGSRGGACASAAKEHEHREHASRLAARRRQTELPEDGRDVLLHRAQGDLEPVCDPLVRAAAGHQLEHLSLPRGETRNRIVRPLPRNEGRHDDRIKCGAAACDPPHGSDELVDVTDPVLQQIPDALRRVG